ncbi:hypothetical protein [Arthrobacter methylotrophus]|uniref:Uncharacterized protein n=1 Tax=Arthrobacter methylotrophus TaxID=121291 RepID=A0ABV5UN07_9MICC
MTTDTAARQPKGIPAGGQFAATAHTEPAIGLVSSEPQSASEHFGVYFAHQELLRRHREQAEVLDHMHQIQSLRCLSSAILAKYPDAAVLRIRESEDGENQFDLISLADADGALLELSLDDDSWTMEEPYLTGPDLRELAWALNPKDDSWAEGVAEFHGGRKYTRMADINLKAATQAPLPDVSPQNDPLTRAFAAQEQKDLIESANFGIITIQDCLDEEHYDSDKKEDLEELRDRVNTLLTNKNR